MTYIGDLITEVRRDTENESYSTNNGDSYGISTEDFLRYANFALQRLQAKLVNQNVTLFRRTTDINLVANQAAYVIPDNVYLGESIVDVQYSPTGQESDFREIREIAESYRCFDVGSYVQGYIRRAGQVLVTPVPNESRGVLRVTYERAINKLDIRRGVLDAVTISGGAISANTLSLDIASDDDTRISGVTDKYLCICDKDGNVKTYNVPYTSYNNANGNFTHLAHTLGTGETAAIGDYITIGKWTSTHTVELNFPEVDRYLSLYMAMKILRRDSNADSELISRELAAIEEEMIETFRTTSKDEWNIQIADEDILLRR